MKGRLETLRSRGLAAHAAVLGLAGLAAYAVVGPVAGWISGPTGLAAAAAAAAWCLLGAISALVVLRLFPDPARLPYALACGMVLRMGIPLSGAVATGIFARPVAEAGLMIYLLAFYPVTLLVDTLLSLPVGGPSRRHHGRF